jgi:hypothetical protein
MNPVTDETKFNLDVLKELERKEEEEKLILFLKKLKDEDRKKGLGD